MKRAFFLDRDGVLNGVDLVDGVPKPPSSIEAVKILPGVVEAIQLLKDYDVVPVVVTNQPDVRRGRMSQALVESINGYIGASTGIEFFYTCLHDDEDRCNCRKPLPGLILQASKDLSLDTCKSFMIGDRWRDISAGQLAGCETFFIDYLYPETPPKRPYTLVSSLLEAVQKITGVSNEAN